jgi:hypothetical protein
MSECKHCDGTGEVEVKDGSVFECAECGGSGELPDHLVLEVEKTKRGFGTIKFEDRYNQKCSLQESSLATEAAVWFGVDVDLNGNKVSQRMHLTQTQVQDLLPMLQRFAETGYLREPEGVTVEEVSHPVMDCPFCGGENCMEVSTDRYGRPYLFSLRAVVPKARDINRVRGIYVPDGRDVLGSICSQCGSVRMHIDADDRFPSDPECEIPDGED